MHTRGPPAGDVEYRWAARALAAIPESVLHSLAIRFVECSRVRRMAELTGPWSDMVLRVCGPSAES